MAKRKQTSPMPARIGAGIARGLRRVWDAIALGFGSVLRGLGRNAASLDPVHGRDGLGLLLLIAALIGAARLWFGAGGWLSAPLADGVVYGTGVFAAAVPVLVLLAAMRVFRHPDEGPENGRLAIGGTLAVWMLLVGRHVLAGAPSPSDPTWSESGGLLGWALAAPLLAAVGKPVTLVIVALVLFFAILILTKTPVAAIPARLRSVLAFVRRHRPAPRAKPEPVEPDSFVADIPFEAVAVIERDQPEEDTATSVDLEHWDDTDLEHDLAEHVTEIVPQPVDPYADTAILELVQPTTSKPTAAAKAKPRQLQLLRRDQLQTALTRFAVDGPHTKTQYPGQ